MAVVNTDCWTIAIAKEIRDEYLLFTEKPPRCSNVAGRIQEEMDSVAEQVRDFALSMMIILVLLAIPLRSYHSHLLSCRLFHSV